MKKLSNIQIFSVITGFCSIISLVIGLYQFSLPSPMYIQVYMPQMSAVTGEFQNILVTVNISQVALFVGVILLFVTVILILQKKKRIFR